MTPRTRSVAAFAVLALVVVVLFERHQIIAAHLAGQIVQGLAALLMLWARVTFGRRSFHAAANPTAGGLVTTGPYRFWRHPIYAAILIFLWAGVLDAAPRPTLTPIALAVAGTLAAAVRIQAEEQLLRATFPEYDAYAARTKRIIPGLL